MQQELSTFGRNLHLILYDKKMTRLELAKKIGKSQQSVSSFIQGRIKPSRDTLIAIADALGVTVDDLIK